MGRARMKRYTNEGMIDQNRPPESSLDGSQYKCESTAMAYCGLFLTSIPHVLKKKDLELEFVVPRVIEFVGIYMGF